MEARFFSVGVTGRKNSRATFLGVQSGWRPLGRFGRTAKHHRLGCRFSEASVLPLLSGVSWVRDRSIQRLWTKFIPRQNKLAVGFKDRIAILNPRTGQTIDRKSIQGDVGEMAASFDGKQLFVLTGAGFVRLNLESSEKTSSKSTLLSTITSLGFSSDDERLVTTGMRSGDSMVSWDLKKGRPASLAPNAPGLETTAVSSDGSYATRMPVDETRSTASSCGTRREKSKH